MWPFRKDSHAQFEQLLSPLMSQLYRLAYHFTGQRDDAEDLVQELLIKVYPRLDEMLSIDKLAPWLSQILYRLFIDEYRKQKRSPIDYIGDDEIIYETQASDDAEPAQIVDSELTGAFLDAALNKLSEAHRTVILLHDVEGYSLEEIGDVVNAPTGTIKSRLSRARSNLREVIRRMDPDFTNNVDTGTGLTQ